MLIKCKGDSSDPYTALLQYRTTSKGNFPSPSEMLMGRVLRTKLPYFSENLEPKLIDRKQIAKKIMKQNENMSKYYNTTTKNLERIEVGEKVLFKRTPVSIWFKGKVVSYSNEPRSFIIQDQDGVSYRRNRQHIRKDLTKETLINTFDENENNNSNDSISDIQNENNTNNLNEQNNNHIENVNENTTNFSTENQNIVNIPNDNENVQNNLNNEYITKSGKSKLPQRFRE